MRVRSIGHACLDIQTRGPRVLTDPWWTGPAYTRQWYPWPRPAHAGVADTAYDYVYLSHGHEDHLHLDTLRTLRPGATAIVPRFAGTGGLGWLRGEGLFADVRELAHGESLDLGGGVTATMYINVTDSMLVLDDGRHVLVDANDALHAAPRATRDDFTALLRARHRRVDSLYLGFGGASWFPNCIHWPGKDDRAEAMRREGALIDNFVSIVEALEPSLACAFAASFVLLEPHLRWVVDARYAVEGPDERLRRVGRAGHTRGHLLLPGDVIDGVHVTPSGDAAPTAASFAAACADGDLARDAAGHAAPPTVDAARVQALVADLDTRARAARWSAPRALRPHTIELALRDAPGVFITIERGVSGGRAQLGRAHAPKARITARTEVWEACVREPYGVEAIVIGYGADVAVERLDDLAYVEALLDGLSPRQSSWRGALAAAAAAPGEAWSTAWTQRGPLALHAAHALKLGALAGPLVEARAALRRVTGRVRGAGGAGDAELGRGAIGVRAARLEG